jgi:hypothetical protein
VVHLILDGFACRYKVLPEGARSIVAYLLPGDMCDWHALAPTIRGEATLGLTGLPVMGQNCPFRLGFLASEHGPKGSVVGFAPSLGGLPEAIGADGVGDRPGPARGRPFPHAPLPGPSSAWGPQRPGRTTPAPGGIAPSVPAPCERRPQSPLTGTCRFE